MYDMMYEQNPKSKLGDRIIFICMIEETNQTMSLYQYTWYTRTGY